MRSRLQRVGVLALIVASMPMALVLETRLRAQFFPPEFDEVREFFAPVLTSWAWACVVGAALFSIAGVVLAWRRVGQIFADPVLASSPATRDRHLFDRLFLWTSVPQIPALLATTMVMLGADYPPALCAIAVSSVGIAVQGAVFEWRVGALSARDAHTAPLPDIAPAR